MEGYEVTLRVEDDCELEEAQVNEIAETVDIALNEIAEVLESHFGGDLSFQLSVRPTAYFGPGSVEVILD